MDAARAATPLRRARRLELMPTRRSSSRRAAQGHRTFLLADEPGLGKTAQALLAAAGRRRLPAAGRRAQRRQDQLGPRGRACGRRTAPATVIHGDGDDIDGFADIVVVNYEVLDRHVGWLGDLGFRGMVVDEAHFIKNKTSQRSQHVLELAERIRARTGRPLLMALTGTPLINDIEDFRAIWQFLGWIDDKKPLRRADGRARGDRPDARPTRASTRPPAAPSSTWASCAAARSTSPPTSRPAASPTCPVELDDEVGRSIREAERELARRLVAALRAARWRPATSRRGRRGHRPRAGRAGSRGWELRGRATRRAPARTSSR